MKCSWLALLTESRQHLGGAGEGYGRHFRFASAVGSLMVLAGLSALLHALIPGLFRDRASRTLDALQAGLKQRSTAEAEAVIGEDSGGLLTLIALSLMVAIFPWAASIDLPVATTLSLLALGFPVAALRATDGEGDADEPFDEAVDHVVIIGGGFSGTMLAVQLARLGESKVTLVERGANPGHGIAYSTGHPAHLLNVRAGKMSAFPDDPGHFARWLAARGLGGADDFAPRRCYGDYLTGLLRGAMVESGGRLAVLRGEAVDVEPAGRGAQVRLADGRSLTADRVVLASGNLPPRGLAALDAAALPPSLYRGDPSSPGLADGLGADDIVLLVGTGLTMVDVAVALADAGFAGRILAVSRRGLLPRVHKAAAAAQFVPPPAGQPVSALLRAVRRSAAEHGWRATIDALRPHTAGLWRGATPDQRACFLRHLRPWWDVHRHRIAPAIADRIEALRAAGRLELIAGRIVAAEVEGEGARVTIRPRAISYRRTVKVARIVNCTGADGDLVGTGDALLARLVARGLIRPDVHRLGIDTAGDGAAIDADGRPSNALYAIGPLTRGRDWEATAVPELRVQAVALAETLAHALAVPAKAA
jgi:uncharacterized NAD(P)/FAD-binding protein YdhS